MKSNLTQQDKDNVGIYMLHNPNTGEAYIGSGILTERQYEHERRLNNGTHPNYKLQRSFKRDPSFEFISVSFQDSNSSEENRIDALNAEQALINEFKENNLLLNIATDVVSPMFGRKHSDEARANMSKAQSGKTLSDEHKMKIGMSNKEYYSTPEGKAKLSQIGTGKTMSEEARQKISDGLKETYRNGYVNAQKGKPTSEETKKKIGDANRGNKHTDETKARIGQALRKPVIVDGVTYDGVVTAAKALGINVNTAHQRIRSKNFENWTYPES